MKINRKMLLVASSFLLLAACNTQQPQQQTAHNNPFTSGNVTLTLKKGVTTEKDVASTFGAPNIVQQDGKGDTWIYQKNAQVSEAKSKNGFATIILAGMGQHSASSSQSSRTMTLVINFDKNKRVSNFKSMTTSF